MKKYINKPLLFIIARGGLSFTGQLCYKQKISPYATGPERLTPLKTKKGSGPVGIIHKHLWLMSTPHTSGRCEDIPIF